MLHRPLQTGACVVWNEKKPPLWRSCVSRKGPDFGGGFIAPLGQWQFGESQGLVRCRSLIIYQKCQLGHYYGPSQSFYHHHHQWWLWWIVRCSHVGKYFDDVLLHHHHRHHDNQERNCKAVQLAPHRSEWPVMCRSPHLNAAYHPLDPVQCNAEQDHNVNPLKMFWIGAQQWWWVMGEKMFTSKICRYTATYNIGYIFNANIHFPLHRTDSKTFLLHFTL